MNRNSLKLGYIPPWCAQTVRYWLKSRATVSMVPCSWLRSRLFSAGASSQRLRLYLCDRSGLYTNGGMAACIAKFSGTIKKQEDEFVSICIDEEFGSPASVHGCPTHDVALHVINAVRKQRPKTFDVFPSGNLCGIVSATARISQDAMRNLPLVDDLVSVRRTSTCRHDVTATFPFSDLLWVRTVRCIPSSSSECNTEHTEASCQFRAPCSTKRLLYCLQSAEWTSDDSSEGQSTQFKPPVGIWPLVSLLLFLEAGLDDKEVRRWLTSTSGDPKLLGDTLQVRALPSSPRELQLQSLCSRTSCLSGTCSHRSDSIVSFLIL